MSKLKAQIFLFIIFLVISLGFTSKIFGQNPTVIPTPAPNIEYALPYPGLLPDNPLYTFKKMRDKIMLFMTRDPLKKSQLYLLFADKQLVMGELLWEKGSYNLAIITFKKAEQSLLQSVLVLGKSNRSESLPPGTLDKLDLATQKHEGIIKNLKDSLTDETKRQELNDVSGITNQAKQQISSLK